MSAAHPYDAFGVEALGSGLNPWGLAAVLPAVLGYSAGVVAMWRHAGRGRGVRGWQIGCYGAGAVVLAVALLSPLDALSDLFFSAHMAQHELLMVVAAPLMVLGRPPTVFSWALPRRARAAVGVLLRLPAVVTLRQVLTAPLLALALHALVRWVWHVPRLFDAAMADDRIHALQHLSFFLTAALFWWSILRGRYGRSGYGLGLLFVFATAMHTSLLAALLTVAPRGCYPSYAALGPPGVTLQDQQLGGLVMWVPSGVVLLASGLALFVAWLGDMERRAARSRIRERAQARG